MIILVASLMGAFLISKGLKRDLIFKGKSSKLAFEVFLELR